MYQYKYIVKKFLPKFKFYHSGFTLVELLVVITIIAILSTIGITIFSGTQVAARDGKRRADVDAISNALEAHYKDTTSPCNATTGDPYCTAAAITGGTFFAGNAYPTDPNPTEGEDYKLYFSTPNRTSYTICAKLKNKNGNSADHGDTTGISFTSASGVTALFYCKKSQQ